MSQEKRGFFRWGDENKTHGFIKPDDGTRDVWVDGNDVANMYLQPGQYVEYQLFTQNDGKLKAVNVYRCYDDPPSQNNNNNDNNNMMMPNNADSHNNSNNLNNSNNSNNSNNNYIPSNSGIPTQEDDY